MDLPIKFKEKMKELLGDSASDFFCELDNPERKGLTVNFSRLPREKFEQNFDVNVSKIKDIDNGYYVNNFKFGKHIFTHMGTIYSQEPSAMYPVELLDIKPNDIVLDVCASPGGKAIQILNKLAGSGLLVANEIVYNRAKILYENLTRMGFDNYILINNNSSDISNSNVLFDKILIDAPCSGEGMFRKNTFDMNEYHEDNIDANADRQLEILNNIKGVLKTGGMLVYSTCTYDIRENENVIVRFLKQNPEFEIVKFENLNIDAEPGVKIDEFNTDYGFRRYPHINTGEGQFMIALRKNGNGIYEDTVFRAKNFVSIGNKERLVIDKSLKNILTNYNFEFVKRNDNIYVLPKTQMNCSSLNVLSVGCLVGNINKNELKIHHNFYHTYGSLFKNKIELKDAMIDKYLHGEELEVSGENGIAVVTYLGVAIGGGKVVNGRLKNYYPKELRI